MSEGRLCELNEIHITHTRNFIQYLEMLGLLYFSNNFLLLQLILPDSPYTFHYLWTELFLVYTCRNATWRRVGVNVCFGTSREFFVLWTILRLYKALSSFIHSIVSILLYKAICHLLFLIDNVDDNLYVQTWTLMFLVYILLKF